jgi:hypothetical protein
MSHARRSRPAAGSAGDAPALLLQRGAAVGVGGAQPLGARYGAEAWRAARAAAAAEAEGHAAASGGDTAQARAQPRRAAAAACGAGVLACGACYAARAAARPRGKQRRTSAAATQRLVSLSRAAAPPASCFYDALETGAHAASPQHTKASRTSLCLARAEEDGPATLRMTG